MTDTATHPVADNETPLNATLDSSTPEQMRHYRDGGTITETDGGTANSGDEYWRLNNAYHRIDGPAAQRDGGPAFGGKQGWFCNGKQHAPTPEQLAAWANNPTNPERVHHLAQGGTITASDQGPFNGGGETWRMDDLAHRIHGPAKQWDDGVANGGGESWHLSGPRHCEHGPAVQEFGGLANGGNEYWMRNGLPYRDDGPAIQTLGGLANGGSEAWYNRGERFKPSTVDVAAWATNPTNPTYVAPTA